MHIDLIYTSISNLFTVQRYSISHNKLMMADWLTSHRMVCKKEYILAIVITQYAWNG